MAIELVPVSGLGKLTKQWGVWMARLAALALLVAPTARADQPSVHGMLLFGDGATYASHLPMFHAPHDYQVIMKLSLVDTPRTQTLLSYEQAKADGNTLFTLVPKPFDLSKVVDGSLFAFPAEIYLGHFERGGESLGPVNVTITELIYAKKLDAQQEPTFFHDYLVFGSAGEYFAAHVIKGKPSFDTILKVTQPQQGSGNHTRLGEILITASPVPDSDLPLQVSSSIVEPKAGDELGAALGVSTTVEQVIYYEKDELSH